MTILAKRSWITLLTPKSLPVIATTSELMSTGVDAQTCKLVVLDQNIQSMTKFKQIIGRGTRINEKHGKLWFTILDFKKATELFADPRFDGLPEKVLVVKRRKTLPILNLILTTSLKTKRQSMNYRFDKWRAERPAIMTQHQVTEVGNSKKMTKTKSASST
jgi:type I site-specific restriction endonuclease